MNMNALENGYFGPGKLYFGIYSILWDNFVVSRGFWSGWPLLENLITPVWL